MGTVVLRKVAPLRTERHRPLPDAFDDASRLPFSPPSRGLLPPTPMRVPLNKLNRSCSKMQLNPRSYRTAPPVPEQPSMGLLQWRVLELAGGARVLAGMFPERMTLRITSPITGYRGRRFTTSSGRVYHLIGAPASDVRVLFSIAEHLLLSGFDRALDVTREFEAVLQARNDVPTAPGASRSSPSDRA